MGNTRDVFLKSYQARHVAQNLVANAFGQELGGNDTILFQSLQRSFLQRDPDAPLYPSEEAMNALEDREDIRQLRAEYRLAVSQRSADDPLAKRLAARVFALRRLLAAQILDQRRREYFSDADRLRALGQEPCRPPDDTNPFKTFDPNGALAAEEISAFMQMEAMEETIEGAVQTTTPVHIVDVYVMYLHRRPAEVRGVLGAIKHKSTNQKTTCDSSEPADNPNRLHRCLFGCGSFQTRGNLTRHNSRVHFFRGRFDLPFACPECIRLGRGEQTINGPMEWSNHCAKKHDPRHAPSLPENMMSRPGVTWVDSVAHAQLAKGEGRCLICGNIFKNAGAFARHFNVVHLDKEELFGKPFLCPVCPFPSCWIEGATAWQSHLVDFHKGGGVFGWLHCPPSSSSKKRGRAMQTQEYEGSKRRRGTSIHNNFCPGTHDTAVEEPIRPASPVLSPPSPVSPDPFLGLIDPALLAMDSASTQDSQFPSCTGLDEAVAEEPTRPISPVLSPASSVSPDPFLGLVDPASLALDGLGYQYSNFGSEPGLVSP